MQQIGKYLLIAGGILLVIGAVFLLFGNRLNFLGRLPGDIRVERENFRFYFPITTLIVISLIINLIIWLVKRLF
ncbi:MAG TPA: DUF2905 domain-containing protein [Niabella sp.]|jgi:hypothetical protein|nr:DUF2905 domain-containing protein [Chitinophagaceae bacterium]HRN48019.1 DUF2905 domain-containing protein [Niabella sp.]HRO83625.1 DUF2905 domain-containing protein [Niabella sp.]